MAVYRAIPTTFAKVHKKHLTPTNSTIAMGMISPTAPLSRLKARIRAAWTPTLVTMLLIYGAGLHYLVLGLPGLGYSKHIELFPVGWRDFSRQIADTAAQIRAQTGVEPLIGTEDNHGGWSHRPGKQVAEGQ